MEIICDMIGAQPREKRIQLYLSPLDEEFAQKICCQFEQRVVVLHTKSACCRNQEWYPERWEEVVTWLQRQHYHVLQVGRDNETSIPGTISMLGKTTIRQALALVKYSCFFMGVDSVFNHATNAYRKRSLILFGASTPTVWGYESNINICKGLKCQPCIDLLYSACEARRCMKRITTTEVITALSQLIHKIG